MWQMKIIRQQNSRAFNHVIMQLFVTLGVFLLPMLVHAQSVEDIIMQQELDGVHWSISVTDEQGQLLESWNDQKWIVPASNMKLITSAAVLEELGAEFRYQTPIYDEGYLDDSTWVGDLMIVGKGDPSISGLFEENRYHVFQQFQELLKSAGICTDGSMDWPVGLF